MVFQIDNGLKINNPTPDQISQHLSEMTLTAILIKDRASYLEVFGNEKIGFVLEYREDSAEECLLSAHPLTLEQAISCVLLYLKNSPDFEQAIVWKQESLLNYQEINSKFFWN